MNKLKIIYKSSEVEKVTAQVQGQKEDEKNLQQNMRLSAELNLVW